MRPMFAGLALLLLLPTACGASGPNHIVFTEKQLGVFHAAAREAIRTEHESFWCGVGHRAWGIYYLDKIIKPTQKAVVYDFGPGVGKASIVTPAICPRGTILDLHTHPWPGVPWLYPSFSDQATYYNNRRYFLHLITFPSEEDGVQILGWFQTPQGLVEIKPGTLIIR